jgi:hypothetical protein
MQPFNRNREWQRAWTVQQLRTNATHIWITSDYKILASYQSMLVPQKQSLLSTLAIYFDHYATRSIHARQQTFGLSNLLTLVLPIVRWDGTLGANLPCPGHLNVHLPPHHIKALTVAAYHCLADVLALHNAANKHKDGRSHRGQREQTCRPIQTTVCTRAVLPPNQPKK